MEDGYEREANIASTQGGGQNRMKEFIKAEEAHRLSLAFSDYSKNKRQEPNLGLQGAMLFSHGPTNGLVFGAAMTVRVACTLVVAFRALHLSVASHPHALPSDNIYPVCLARLSALTELALYQPCRAK